MKKIVAWSLVTAVVAGSFALGTLVNAEDKKAASGDCGMSQEEMMKAFTEYTTPGESHKRLEWFVGTWNGDSKMWMDPNSTEPMTSTAKIETKSIFGGRFIEETFSGTCPIMNTPFEGRSITGYDNKKKQYHQYWIDNMGTGSLLQTGEYKDADKTYRFSGTMTCPMCGDLPTRNEVKIVDENTYEFRMFHTFDGKEMKVLEMTLKRDSKKATR